MLMTVKDAAQKLACSKSTIYRMVKTSQLRTRKIGIGESTYRILAEDVDAIINPPQPVTYERGSLRRRMS